MTATVLYVFGLAVLAQEVAVVHVDGVRLSLDCCHRRAYCLSPSDV
jgi:hypothetical protein